MEQHFELAHCTSFQSNSLFELQQFCTEYIAKSPSKIFKSLDFTSLPEKSLISLLKRDDLQMKEVETWERVLKWGLKKNPTLTPDPTTWSDDDFKMMKNTLQNSLPLVRFFSLSSEEFVQKVDPYRKLLKPQLYEDLYKSYLDPNRRPDDNILLPRSRNINEIIDSKIANIHIVSLISRWIDKMDIKSKFNFLRELYLPYEFKLLLRGSRDGFTPCKFHKLCNNVPHTVTLIKLKETEEIIGGYNPSIWQSAGLRGKTKDSFIFSFKNKNNFKDHILSNVNTIEEALIYSPNHGPSFSVDLILYGTSVTKDYDVKYCGHKNYENKIMEGDFLIEDYEVFQIMKKRR
jgi:hypothetical protein